MNLQYSQSAQSEEKRKRNAFVISLVTGVVFTIIAIFSGIAGYSENGVPGLLGFAITGVVALVAYTSAIQCNLGRPTLGIMILISTILTLALAIPVVVHGQGLALGVMVAMLVAGITSTTLPAEWSTRAIAGAFITAAIITLADLYLPDFGLPTNQRYSNYIAVVTSILYAIFILSRYNTYSLRNKIIIAFILITVTPLITLGVTNSLSSSETLKTQSKAQLTALAKSWQIELTNS